MLSNYPTGVTGNEPEISGVWAEICVNCGTNFESTDGEDNCEKCENYTFSELYEQAYSFAISKGVSEAEAKQYADAYAENVIKLGKYDQVRE